MSNVQSRFSNQLELYESNIIIENKVVDQLYNCDVIFLLFEIIFLFLLVFFFEPPGKNL